MAKLATRDVAGRKINPLNTRSNRQLLLSEGSQRQEAETLNLHSWHEERDERRPSGSRLILDV